MSFAEYYNLFYQKKERSLMEEASLIDCMKRNVNYSTQVAAMAWRTSDGKRPSTFKEYVQAFAEMDEELQQLKHRQPRASAATPAASSKTKPTPMGPINPLGARTATAVPVIPAVPATSISTGDPMDLSSAIAAVQGKPLSILGVKEICNKWKLCYYCKLQHPGKTAKECPNKKPFTLCIMEVDNTASMDGGVSIHTGKV